VGKEIGAPADIEKPRGVASLIDNYVRGLLLPAARRNEALVDRLTKDLVKIAEAELGDKYQPGFLTRADALDVLRKLDPKDPDERLEILRRSRLLDSPSDSDVIRVAPDPVAEHLVARMRMEELRGDVRSWRSFLGRIRKQDLSEGFVAALAACADNEVYGKPVPASVRQDIKRLNDGLGTDQIAA
jgi:hypothetical protein